MSLTLRQIRYFVATAETGRVSQAAAGLSISQSAVTTAIKELETAVGFDLFERTKLGMELTTAGRQFLSHAYEILNKVDEATRLNVETGEIEGKLAVAATYTVMGYFLPFHLERIHRMFPKLLIQLFEVSREAIEEGLLARRYDIAVLLTSNTRNRSLTTETLLKSARRLWLPAHHKLLDRDSVGLQHIAEEPYVMLTVDEAAHTALKYWSRTPFQPSVRLRTSSVEAVRSLVANGQGVAILSDMVHRPWSLEGKRIETVVVADSIPSMDVGLAWRKNIEFTPAMNAFRSYFRQTYHIPNSR